LSQENPGESGSGNNDQKRSGVIVGKLWVPVVIFIGTLFGVISYEIAAATSRFPHFHPPGGPPAGPDIFLELHIILSTIGIALLVALIIVYARTYVKTKANFILGLLVFLFALLLQSLLTYPVILELETGFAIEVFSPVADVFTIVAYTVFLYLSLE
jgi:hypothetical protein